MRERLIELFEQFDCSDTVLSDDVLDKCEELCLEFDITDPAVFVDQWVAFSLTNLEDTSPTIPHLLEMERKVLIPNRDKKNAESVKKRKSASHKIESNASVYNNFSPAVAAGSLNNDDDDAIEDEVVDTYCQTPKDRKSFIARTPARQNDGILFSPVSYSPITGTPRTTSKDGGKIVYTFGSSALLEQINWSPVEKPEKIILKQLLTHNNEPLKHKCRFMFDKLIDKALILHDRLLHVGSGIIKKAFGKNAISIHDFDEPSQYEMNTVGRIYCESDDDKLNDKSAMLMGISSRNEYLVDNCEDTEAIGLQNVSLNFTKMNSGGIFPGQIVMVTGTNPSGDTIFVKEILAERSLMLPEPPKLESDLRCVIAAGPYTNNDDLGYSPLQDLLAYCKENKPDLLILIGPFVEANHEIIKGNVLAETFDSFFEKMVSGIFETLEDEMTICIVSSQKDVVSTCVYPTHPLTTVKTYQNIHMLPDPCIIDVNGFTIGATSTDIMKYLLEEEFAFNAGEKIKRVVNYMFHQGSFYPLEPPSIETNFDSDLANKYAKLEMVPNMLILPSDQKYFIRDINKCLVVNPGRIVSPSGGTFTRLIISSPSGENQLTSNYIAGQIMRV